jgi:hypothetical protein
MRGSLDIRVMTPDDLERAIFWAASEGWNPGVADSGPFRAADPEGFLMGFVDDEPVTAISVVRYGTNFGFLGFYICAPHARGKGYGWATWKAGMARLGDRVIGLDGVVAQQANYRKSGFVLAHRNVRYGGEVTVEAPGDPHIQKIAAPLIPAVVDYDRRFFPAPREAFVQAWLRSDRRLPLAYVDGGLVRGYGVIRPCRQGHKIGPLFADSPAIAETLFQALAASMPGLIFLDPPQPNGAAVALAQRYGLTPVFETARMYRGPAPSLPLEKIFGITTFELG